MMKQKLSIFIGWQRVIFALVALLSGFLGTAYCQDNATRPFAGRQLGTDSTVLLLQQSDPEAGTVTPDIGVHYFGLNTEVSVAAIPKPGYYFLYWIGDVTDPTANNTIVYLDTPKIVIAVFERAAFEILEEDEVANTRGRLGGTRPRAGDYIRRGGGGSLKYERFKWQWPESPKREPPIGPQPPVVPDDFPIPEEEPNDFPVPHLPEPATALLLGLGGLLFVRGGAKR